MDYSSFEGECDKQHPSVPGFLSARDDDLLYATPSRMLGAYDPQNGSERWRFKDPEFCVRELVPSERRLVVIETRRQPEPKIYLTPVFYTLDYVLVALDSETGTPLWRTELPGDVVPGSLTVQGDRIYLTGRLLWSQLENDVRGDEIPQLHAVDLADGSIRWSSPLQSMRSVADYNPIATVTLRPAEGAVLVFKTSIYGSWDAEAFESDTGVRRWAIPVQPRSEKGKAIERPQLGLVSNGRFSLVRGTALDFYSLVTGEWLERIEAEWWPDGYLRHLEKHVMYEYRGGNLGAFSMETGKRIWTSELGEKKNWKHQTRGNRGIDIRGDVLSIGSGDGYIYLVNTEDGKIRGRTGYGGYHTGGPAYIFGDAVILIDHDSIVRFRPHYTIWEKLNPF